MVGSDYIARSALRHDTAVSRAFLRALGVPAPEPARAGLVVDVRRLRDLEWCFANHGSPMDGRP